MSEAASFNIDEFCARHDISRGKYFGMRKAGLGPREMRIGAGTVRITVESERAWQHARENPAGDELTEIEQGKAVLAARGRAAGTIAAKSPKHVSRTGRKAAQRRSSRT